MIEDGKAQVKRTYDSPKVTMISLRPEEAVLGHCKTATTAGPVQSGCHLAGMGNCQGIGS
jgi:hypothetical protein